MPEGEGAAPRRAMLTGAEIEAVYLEHRPELERVIHRRVGNRDAAADLVQDLFLRLNRLANRLPSSSEARFYLLRMAHNIGKDHVRVSRNRSRLLEGLILLYDVQPDNQEDMLEQRQRLGAIEAWIGQLSERQGDMLRRSRILGQDYRTIASAWSVSISTVEQEIAKALRYIRAQTRRDEGDQA